MTALLKAVNDKAPAADVKAAIAKVADEHKAAQTAYVKAQDDLRKLLTPLQEGYLWTVGVFQ